MNVSRIYIGGWFQRTSLHLAEIYDFLRGKDSPLQLEPERLRAFRDRLTIHGLEFVNDDFEYVIFESANGIQTKIFEDGLIVLSSDADGSLKAGADELAEFYNNRLSPAFSYLFSIGAPVPKELANIKTIYPFFVVLNDAEDDDIDSVFSVMEEKRHSHASTKTFTIYRGDKLYVINNMGEKSSNIQTLIEEQIFLREFKSQLHQYLNLHRHIWGKIAAVKERGSISGREVDPLAKAVENYSKTVNLIETRISQMGTYIDTRASIFQSKKTLQQYAHVLEYEYETLVDTLRYIKELWAMTRNYVHSAHRYFSELQQKSTETSIKNLTVVSLLTAGGALISLLSREELALTYVGLLHVVVIAAFVYAANAVIRLYYKNHIYKIEDLETIKDIEKK